MIKSLCSGLNHRVENHINYEESKDVLLTNCFIIKLFFSPPFSSSLYLKSDIKPLALE